MGWWLSRLPTKRSYFELSWGNHRETTSFYVWKSSSRATPPASAERSFHCVRVRCPLSAGTWNYHPGRSTRSMGWACVENTFVEDDWKLSAVRNQHPNAQALSPSLGDCSPPGWIKIPDQLRWQACQRTPGGPSAQMTSVVDAPLNHNPGGPSAQFPDLVNVRELHFPGINCSSVMSDSATTGKHLATRWRFAIHSSVIMNGWSWVDLHRVAESSRVMSEANCWPATNWGPPRPALP